MLFDDRLKRLECLTNDEETIATICILTKAPRTLE
jgi:hypothetical protein